VGSQNYPPLFPVMNGGQNEHVSRAV